MSNEVKLSDIQKIVNNTPLKRWEFVVPTPDGKALRGLCDANTKSEVRAQLKRALPGGKVPYGTVIRITSFNPRQAVFDKTVQALAEHVAKEVENRVSADNAAVDTPATGGDGEAGDSDIQCPDSVGVDPAASPATGTDGSDPVVES